MYEFKVQTIVVSLNALELTILVLCPALKYICSYFEAIESKGTYPFSGLDSGLFKMYFKP